MMNETPDTQEKKSKRLLLPVLCALGALILGFALGWRVMPKVWPGIRDALLGGTKTEAAAQPTPEPYVPKATAAFDDPIAATDSLIYYFYKDYCPYCRELTPLMEGLPAEVTLPDGTRSAVRLVCLNKVEEAPAAVIAAYYGDHDVPEDRQYVPAVVIGDRYLFPGSEIIAQLLEALTAGEGLNTPVLNGAQRLQTP